MNITHGIHKLLLYLKYKRLFLIFLIILNIIGILYNIEYIWSSFFKIPFYFWFFILDCSIPLVVVIIALILRIKKRENHVVNTFAFIGILKIGFCQIIFFMLYSSYFFDPTASHYYETTFVGILHFGIMGESLFFIGNMTNVKKWWYLVFFSFFTFTDLMDYFILVVPPDPNAPILLFHIHIVIYIFVNALLAFFAYKISSTLDEDLVVDGKSKEPS
jgi:uncharacterized membrane protein YpjA